MACDRPDPSTNPVLKSAVGFVAIAKSANFCMHLAVAAAIESASPYAVSAVPFEDKWTKVSSELRRSCAI